MYEFLYQCRVRWVWDITRYPSPSKLESTTFKEIHFLLLLHLDATFLEHHLGVSGYVYNSTMSVRQKTGELVIFEI